MKTNLLISLIFGLSLVLNGQAQTTAFTYQGRLTDNGSPPNGLYDLQFTVRDTAASGTSIAGPLTVSAVPVSNGLFTATLDFGTGVFDGRPRWLEIGVRGTSGAGAFTVLSPRQPITATPYAIQAAGISGTVPDAQLSANIPRLSGSNYVTGAMMFAPTSGAPFRVGNNKLVANLNADLFDGKDSTAFAPATNSPSYVARAGDTMNGPLNLPSDGLTVGVNQLAVTNGNVGIGTTVPEARLDIAGVVKAESLMIGVNQSLNGLLSTIAGGLRNTNLSSASSIGGGAVNLVPTNAQYATISGGFGNTAGAAYATVPGGMSNSASGLWSFAAGQRAKATNEGAFVWADASTTNSLTSTNKNQFLVRAAGGTRFLSSSNSTTGVQLNPGSGAWASLSDRNAKENVRAIDAPAVLEKVAALPLSTWNYKSQDKSIRHIGPMAQDFQAAFGVGENDTTITTVDADGVALAAIQGLYEVVREKDARIIKLEDELTELKRAVQSLARGSKEN